MPQRISLAPLALHVAVEQEGESKIVGYVNLDLEKTLRSVSSPPRPNYRIALIEQIATSKDRQGQGIGTRLLYFSLYRALIASPYLDLVGVAVNVLQDVEEDLAVLEKRRAFYIDRGFNPLIDDSRLFISMKEIEKMGLQ